MARTSILRFALLAIAPALITCHSDAPVLPEPRRKVSFLSPPALDAFRESANVGNEAPYHC